MNNEERHENNTFSVIADFEGDEENLLNIKVDDVLPVLPLRNMVLFPGVFMPVSIGRRSSLRLIREANRNNAYIAVTCQKGYIVAGAGGGLRDSHLFQP